MVGRRCQVEKIQHQQFFRAVAHPERVVDHQGLGMDHLQQVGIGDIAHVEGRILAQQHHVHLAQIAGLARAQREVVALLGLHLKRPARGHHLAAVPSQVGHVVIEQFMPAQLRLQRKAEGRIGGNVDGLDRVHLNGDGKRHHPSRGVWIRENRARRKARAAGSASASSRARGCARGCARGRFGGGNRADPARVVDGQHMAHLIVSTL
jgi:hypothetical protein